MKMPSGKILLLGAAALGLAAAVYLTRARPLVVEIARPEKNVEVQVFGLGTVEARLLSKIGFRISNRLVLLTVDEGDRVKKGQLLARLDDAEQKARLLKARAGVLSARAALQAARAGVDKARAVLEEKRRTNARKQALFRRRTVSAEAADAARIAYQVAKADLAGAKGNLATSQAALVTAEAAVKLEEVALAQHELRAPFDAVVVKRHLEAGSVPKAGEPVFTLVAPSSVWVLGHISESRAGLIRVGQKAQVRLRSKPHRVFAGKVARIDIESDRVTEERQVYVVCKACRENFTLGEQAEVYVTTAVLDEALLVPENAVDDFDERHMAGTVWIVENGRLKKRKVLFGHRTLDARLTLVGDLPKGVEVLSRLPAVLREGRAVRIAQKGEKTGGEAAQ